VQNAPGIERDIVACQVDEDPVHKWPVNIGKYVYKWYHVEKKNEFRKRRAGLRE
jgi:hypothetical protein